MNTCLNCKKLTKNPKFCCRSCSATINNIKTPKRKTNKKCSHCDNVIKNYKSNLCLVHYELYKKRTIEYIENLTLNDYINRESVKKLHKSSKFCHIRSLGRNKHKELLKLPCANCKYNKHVELCHIKPISSFSNEAKIKEINSVDNVIQLCPNCHWEFDNNLINIKDIKVAQMGLEPI